jgi:hypothetical protein
MKVTPLKAIRLHCLDCSGGSTKEVRLCVISDCPLYPYRFGRNPKKKGQGQIENLKKSEEIAHAGR